MVVCAQFEGFGLVSNFECTYSYLRDEAGPVRPRSPRYYVTQDQKLRWNVVMWMRY